MDCKPLGGPGHVLLPLAPSEAMMMTALMSIEDKERTWKRVNLHSSIIDAIGPNSEILP